MMFKTIIYSVVIILPFFTSPAKCEEPLLTDTEFLMTFMVHRHGDRTPFASSLAYVTDEEAVMKVIDQYGCGQLTDVGINRGYHTGKFIRQRYDELLSPKYNKSEIYIRSTDSTRAKMTVLAAIAAVYPVEESWCKDLEGCDTSSWTPVPYTTYLASSNCPVYITEVGAAYTSPASQMDKYADVLDRWSNIIGFNITAYPCLVYGIYDVYTGQISMGVPLTDELEEMFPEIEQVAGEAIDVVFGNKEYISLGASVLLNEFIEAANNIIAGEDVPRVYVYSGHDFNVFSLFVATKAKPLPGVPKYGAVYALELRKVLSTEQYIVVPVYLNTPDYPDQVSYPTVKGCGDICEFSSFQELVADNVLDQAEWMTQCEWSADYDFDFSTVA